jgi:hypothetical protein
VASSRQGADGVAHLTLYDPDTQLSFVFDGNAIGLVEVSHGGYGEPVVDQFTIRTWPYAGPRAQLNWFEEMCRQWIERRRKAESRWAIVFWHREDSRPAIRIIRGTEAEADAARDKVAAIYGDPETRVVEIADEHDDLDDIEANYAETAAVEE